MEMPTIGQRCALEECKQLDFLPFECAHCQLTFCKYHYMPDDHQCARFENKEANIEETLPFKHYRCTFPLCLVQNPLEMRCPVCEEHFCLEHRHHGCIDAPQSVRDKEREKWDAPKKLFEAAKAEADRQVTSNLSSAIKKPGISKTAIKVQLMRLKAKAVGAKGVPTTDRVYFLIYLPLALHRKSKAIYVGRFWTVGRVIDAASELCDVINKNNQASSQKLRLFHHSDGGILASEMDRKLDDLLNEDLVVNGESLVLEYLVGLEGKIESLEDVKRYQD